MLRCFKTELPVQGQVKEVVGMSNAGGREGRETGCASRVKGVLSIAASRGHLRHSKAKLIRSVAAYNTVYKMEGIASNSM